MQTNNQASVCFQLSLFSESHCLFRKELIFMMNLSFLHQLFSRVWLIRSARIKTNQNLQLKMRWSCFSFRKIYSLSLPSLFKKKKKICFSCCHTGTDVNEFPNENFFLWHSGSLSLSILHKIVNRYYL